MEDGTNDLARLRPLDRQVELLSHALSDSRSKPCLKQIFA